MNAITDLVGKTIANRWLVLEHLNTKSGGSTGGYFSIPFKVQSTTDGKLAFMKAIDIVNAMTTTYKDLSRVESMRRVLDNHSFEVQLGTICAGKRMTRVIHPIDSGEHEIDSPLGKLPLPFIVFELGQGDIHSLLDKTGRGDTKWKLAIMHQVATGIKQLHAERIAHQDVKRSNVVLFSQNQSKIADLGRAVRINNTSRNDSREVPCQFQNSPPELLYGFVPADWGERHLATDLYMVGNLFYTLFNDVTITSTILAAIPHELGVFQYSGNYANIIPFLHKGLIHALDIGSTNVPTPLQEDFRELLTYLCHPDPSQRGHPRARSVAQGSPYSMERFISAFTSLRRKAITLGL
jgi:serine/threonine protein kinase